MLLFDTLILPDKLILPLALPTKPPARTDASTLVLSTITFCKFNVPYVLPISAPAEPSIGFLLLELTVMLLFVIVILFISRLLLAEALPIKSPPNPELPLGAVTLSCALSKVRFLMVEAPKSVE